MLMLISDKHMALTFIVGRVTGVYSRSEWCIWDRMEGRTNRRGILKTKRSHSYCSGTHSLGFIASLRTINSARFRPCKYLLQRTHTDRCSRFGVQLFETAHLTASVEEVH